MTEVKGSTSGGEDTLFVAETPIGLRVNVGATRLNEKAVQHGAAWCNEGQCKVLLEDPIAIYESQHDWASGMLLFFREADAATLGPKGVKYVRAVADFRNGDPGEFISMQPKTKFGQVGRRLYPLDTEDTDAE